jgi:signal transduction histidine kinase
VYQISFKFKSPTILLLVLLCVTHISRAQNSKAIDSLTVVLNDQGTSDGDRYAATYDLAFEYIFAKDFAKALSYIDQARELALSFGDTTKIIKSGRVRAQVLTQLGRTNDGINQFLDILPIVQRHSKDNPTLLLEYKFVLNSIAVTYTFQANYDKALQYHFQSLILREKEGTPEEVSTTLNNIGLVYFKLKNYEKALEYYLRALDLKNKSNDDNFKGKLLINIGLCYNQIKQYTKAQEYINSGLAFCAPECDDFTFMHSNFGLGVSFYGLENFKEAEPHFHKSLALARKTEDIRFQLDNLVYLGRIYIKEKREKEAIDTLTLAESIASKTELNQLRIEIYREFANIYNQVSDYKNAVNYQEKYIQLKDSIFGEELIKNIASVQTDFEERENKAIIASKEVVIKQQRDLNIAVAIIAILAGLLILVLLRSNRISKQVNAQLSEAKETIQEQNKLLELKNKDLDREVERKTIDLERANLSLKQVNDELDNFIYKTSHDIRGPLASLKGMCNVALMDVRDPVALDYLRKLDTTAERLNTILTRLLIINQINNSKLSLSIIDFRTIVNDVLLLERKKGLPQKLSIRNKIEGHAIIKSDKELVRIVLENLIDNAIKFYNESDRVDSFVEILIQPADNSSVKIRVIDNGIGISEANPGKLFQMFFRASERSEIGGIGLYIVKTATAKLGGKVGLLTTPEGFTEFYVIFPAYPPTQDEGSIKQDFL